MEKHSFEVGPIRPPSEASSLLLRVTRNCPWNKCKFCGVYKGSRFSVRSVEEIKQDIDGMAYYKERLLQYRKPDGSPDYRAMVKAFQNVDDEQRDSVYNVLNWLANGKGESVFLQDANSVVLMPEKLTEVLRYLRKTFPEIKRVTSYARADTLAKLPLERLRELKEAGLDRVHSGYETGSDRVLEMIQKGCTKAQEIEGGLKTREAGLELSIYFMPGVGGRALSQENALETADVINQVNPDFVRLRTFVAKPGTESGADVEEGRLIPLSDEEKVEEIRQMLLAVKDCDGILVSDHIVNLLESVTGSLRYDKDQMIGEIEKFQKLPEWKRRQFQLARRMGMVRRIEDSIPMQTMGQIDRLCEDAQSSDEWEELMNYFLQRYI